MAFQPNYLGLARTLRQMADVPSLVSKDVAEAWTARIQAGFEAGTDPYGIGWDALKPATLAKGRFPPPLTDKRALKGSQRLIPLSGAGVQLANGFGPYYGNHHMTGAANMAKRRFFPDAGLPATWKQDLQDALTARVKERFGD